MAGAGQQSRDGRPAERSGDKDRRRQDPTEAQRRTGQLETHKKHVPSEARPVSAADSSADGESKVLSQEMRKRFNKFKVINFVFVR